MLRRTALFLICLLPWSVLPAQSTRADLLFALNSALKARNRAAVARCFNFEGADEATRKAMVTVITEICAWPTHHVFTTERQGAGPLRSEQGGKMHTLNGDWTFQVHIFQKEPPSKGFVFPAGEVGSKNLLLMMVPAEKAAPPSIKTP